MLRNLYIEFENIYWILILSIKILSQPCWKQKFRNVKKLLYLLNIFKFQKKNYRQTVNFPFKLEIFQINWKLYRKL